ncbi:MAG: hypothetical protein Q4G28_06610 [Neisseria sp.]|nr:hypothetical protein [Neisseria sp.]
MNKAALILFLAALAFPAAVQGKVIFSCTDQRGKQILVTEQNDRFRYRYGRKDTPELRFENDRAEVLARSPRWDGKGRSAWVNLALENGNYRYTLYTSLDRLSSRRRAISGLIIQNAAASPDGTHRYIDVRKCKTTALTDFPAELALPAD